MIKEITTFFFLLAELWNTNWIKCIIYTNMLLKFFSKEVWLKGGCLWWCFRAWEEACLIFHEKTKFLGEEGTFCQHTHWWWHTMLCVCYTFWNMWGSIKNVIILSKLTFSLSRNYLYLQVLLLKLLTKIH